MIESLPYYIPITFILTTALTGWLLLQAMRKSDAESTRKKTIPAAIAFTGWLALQGMLAWKGVYSQNLDSLPPKIMLLGVLPCLLVILVLFVTTAGRKFMDDLPLTSLTYIHVVRIPVEIVLFWLYLQKAIPQLMTFEGRNFDILAGITALLVAYFGITKGKAGRHAILVWNIICLGLLLNIVLHAVFSAPFPFQQLAFDQPNRAILYFPFCWLPAFIVPVVLFAHLAAMRKLLRKKNNS